MTSKGLEALNEMLYLITEYSYYVRAHNYYETIKKDLERLEKVKQLKSNIEEKIENAKNDYKRCFEDIDYSYSKNDELKGEILAYTDILILLKEVLE